MKPSFTSIFAIKLIAFYAIFTSTSRTFAHDGHGFSGTHWHATDAWGFALIGVLLTVAVWLGRGGK